VRLRNARETGLAQSTGLGIRAVCSAVNNSNSHAADAVTNSRLTSHSVSLSGSVLTLRKSLSDTRDLISIKLPQIAGTGLRY
jgi:hypothetical protein